MRFLGVLLLLIVVGCSDQPQPPEGAEWLDEDTLAVCGLYHIQGGDTSFVYSAWPTDEHINYMRTTGMTKYDGMFTHIGRTEVLQDAAQSGVLQHAEYTCHRFVKP